MHNQKQHHLAYVTITDNTGMSNRILALLWYPKPTIKPRFYAETVRCQKLDFTCHNWWL